MFNEEMRDELINGLCGIFQDNLRQIILYGSVARNDYNPDSDIDIAIILNQELTAENKEAFISFSADMDLKYDRVFSIIDIEQSKMDKWGHILAFYRNIQDEGIVLWTAA